jgi:hypothetical protein
MYERKGEYGTCGLMDQRHEVEVSVWLSVDEHVAGIFRPFVVKARVLYSIMF